MDKNTLDEIHSIIKKIENINNRTENKIDQLLIAIMEYDEIIKNLDNFNGFQVSEFIQQIIEAKNKRKNVSRKYIHGQFLRIKDLVLFRLKHNYSILKFNSKKD